MTTYITFVLDETGSMAGTQKETVSGFNDYVKNIRKELPNEEIKFSVLKFNSLRKNWLALNVMLKDVAELSDVNYSPAGWTPLYDAFGMAIEQMESQDVTDEDKVIIAVLTDGYENASSEYNKDSVKSLIEAHKDWAIVFLGANIDAWGEGSKMGMSRGQTYTFNQEDTTRTMGGVLADASVMYLTGESNAETFFKDTDGTDS